MFRNGLCSWRLRSRRSDSPVRKRNVIITHPDKILFPDDGITKGELAAYYEMIAPLMLPHLARRPVTMERYPAGIDRKGFIQKDRQGFAEKENSNVPFFVSLFFTVMRTGLPFRVRVPLPVAVSPPTDRLPLTSIRTC